MSISDSVTFKVLIVGLGNIGMGYDLHHDANRYILSHARAFHSHPRFRLVGGVDPDPDRRQLFERHYCCETCHDIESAMARLQPDVVVISTPTAIHSETIDMVLKAGKPSAILCEKPLSFDIDDAGKILSSCKQCECKLYVNYMRYSDPVTAGIGARLKEGSIGHPVKGVTWYCKGLYNSGSHFINLLQNFLGDVSDVKVVNVGDSFGMQDIEPDVMITFALGKVYFIASSAKYFFHNTVELIASNGRLRYEQGGEQIVWQPTVESNIYKGYANLAAGGEYIASDFLRMQWHVTDQLAVSLDGSDARICSGEEAFKTLEVIDRIKKDCL